MKKFTLQGIHCGYKNWQARKAHMKGHMKAHMTHLLLLVTNPQQIHENYILRKLVLGKLVLVKNFTL